MPEGALERLLASFPDGDAPRYVLEIGCGDGARLAVAADRGWKCFGIEADDGIRATTLERYRGRMEIVADLGELVPHEFDLVLAAGVLDQIGDPFAWMFGLFNAGAIGPATRVVLTASDADRDPATTDTRLLDSGEPTVRIGHTARSLTQWLSAMLFERVDVRTIDVAPGAGPGLSAKLVCEAEGSRFYGFMLERYVPGTWSKLAEYEHVPRYQFARRFAAGSRVLDFGCGTGYGSRHLADVAADVLGLDIDAEALQWAAFWHDPSRLHFERHADLGATLPSSSFDLVTCFEMIEHVDHATQQATIASLARVVTPDGKLLISTPNPAVTVHYGPNPYHLREMTEAEFVALLAPHFEHVAVYRQWVRPSILIGSEPVPSTPTWTADRLSAERVVDEPPAFVAVCSHRPLEPIAPFCTFDGSFDMVLAETRTQKTMTGLRFEGYLLREERDEAGRRASHALEEAGRRDVAARAATAALAEQTATIESMRAAFAEQEANIAALRAELAGGPDRSAQVGAMEAALADQAGTIASMHDGFARQEANIAALREEIEGATALAGQRAARIAELEATLDERGTAADTALRLQARTIAALHEDFASQEANIRALREATDASAATVAAREVHIGELQAALDEQAGTIGGMRDAFAAQQANIEALRDEASARDEALRTHVETIVAQQAALDGQAAEIARMHEAFATQAANIEALRGDLAGKDDVVRSHVATIEALQRELERAETGHVASRSVIERQELELLELRQKFALQEQNIEKMVADFAAQARNIADLRAVVAERDATIDAQREAHAMHDAEIRELQAAAARQVQVIGTLESLLAQRTAEKDEWHRHYVALEHTRFVRLARLLHGNSGSRSPVLEIFYLLAGGVIPKGLKTRLAPVATKLRSRFAKRRDDVPVLAPYVVKPPVRVRASRPRVLHVIANFMTGGSSRLVVDLLEHLGGDYHQRILTSFIPSPPNYLGVDIVEIAATDPAAMRDLFARFDPHIVHVHYWGDCDEPWYRAVFTVAAERNSPILQNINTPVAPFTDVPLARNVFVSRYVLDHFGDGLAHNTVIYPGSDFTLFAQARRPRRAQKCIGMVYRLERDKLDESAIEPFIEAAHAMPGLRCLIVGGGSLLQPFQQRVAAEGLEDAFEFTGYVSYEALPALYRRMDVFVAPIWKESFGQVSAFAMNMGIPVVGYDVGAIPEIVADPSLVAVSRDAKGLAAIAVGLVRNDAARASIGVANRERATRMFSVEAMIGSYRELYRDVVRQGA